MLVIVRIQKTILLSLIDAFDEQSCQEETNTLKQARTHAHYAHQNDMIRNMFLQRLNTSLLKRFIKKAKT